MGEGFRISYWDCSAFLRELFTPLLIPFWEIQAGSAQLVVQQPLVIFPWEVTLSLPLKARLFRQAQGYFSSCHSGLQTYHCVQCSI